MEFPAGIVFGWFLTILIISGLESTSGHETDWFNEDNTHIEHRVEVISSDTTKYIRIVND